MSYYLQKLELLESSCFANQAQLELAIRTKRYIDANFAEDLSLDFLAQLQCTSKYHLLRIFKRYYGITPRQYLINHRVEMAKKALASGNAVAATCYAVGFDSVSSFSNLFRAKTGQSPSAYKRATFDNSKK